MIEGQRFLFVKEAAIHLGLSPTTLNVWRSEGRGPLYYKLGQAVRYKLADLDIWGISDAAKRKALEESFECHRVKRGTAKRARGRAGAEQRKRRLEAEPLCRDCLEAGVTRYSEEIDHIVRIAFGGSDNDDNIRALCKPCHEKRTKQQAICAGR